MSLVEISATNDLTARCDPRTTCRIPDELICQLCGDLLSEAVMLPCCAISTCDVCAKDALKISLEEGARACPLEGCTLECSVEDLIPNRRLRQNALTLRQQYPNVFGTKKNIFTITKNKNNMPSSTSMPIEATGDRSTLDTTPTINYIRKKAKYQFEASPDKSSPIVIKQRVILQSTPSNNSATNQDNRNCIVNSQVEDICTNAVEKLEKPSLNPNKTWKVNIDSEPSINESTSIDQSVSMSVSYNLLNEKDKIEQENPNSHEKSDMILAQKEVDVEFNYSSSSEPPVPGEECINGFIDDNLQELCDERTAKQNNHLAKAAKDNYTNTKSTSEKIKEKYILPPKNKDDIRISHKIDIPTHYMYEAVDDPLAVFNKLMAAKDREKGILNSDEYYGAPREYYKPNFPPSQRIYNDHPPQYSASGKPRPLYGRPYSSYDRSSYNHGRCYCCDRFGHSLKDCPYRHSPPRTTFRRDYRRYHHVRSSYDEIITREEDYYSSKKKLHPRRSVSPKSDEVRAFYNKKGESSSPVDNPLPDVENSSQHSPHVDAKRDISPHHNSNKQKKSKNKDKHTSHSSTVSKHTKKKKEKKERKETSTFLALNAQILERCTKKKKSKKKMSSDCEIIPSSDYHPGGETTKQKGKLKKKRIKAAEILDKELLHLLSREYPKIKKELLGPNPRSQKTDKRSKEKIFKKKCDKISSKSLKNESGNKCSSSKKREVMEVKLEPGQKREIKIIRRKTKKS